MDRFYIPFNHKIDNLPLIVYPAKDENPIEYVVKNESDIISKLDTLYSKNKILHKGNYHIVFVWSLNKTLMFDVWVHDIENSTESGPLVECHTFKEYTEIFDAGVASGDSLIVLGREEELRRTCSSLDSYLNRMILMPNFPSGYRPNMKF